MGRRQLETDGHHILFQRHPWESQTSLLALRSDSQLITEMNRGQHEALHAAVACVPVLSAYLAERTFRNLRSYERTDDTIESIENLQRSIELASERSKRRDRIEHEIAQLAVYALDLQKPFIDSNYRGAVIDLGALRREKPYYP